MKRLWLSAFLSITVLAGASPVAATTCTLDVVPAATLLLPYFEVDLENPSGKTTLISINNVGDKAALAHVVVWTDLGVPTLAFDVYLTGYDVQTVNLRDLFAGVLPATADAARDRGNVISPQGSLSQDVSFPGCAGLLPPTPPTAAMVEGLRRAHRGLSSSLAGGQCMGQLFGDQITRGYVTVDVARRCSPLTPADPGYFGPDGVAGDDNVLWGDFIYVDPAENFAQGENLVRIESDPARFQGRETFYGRYVDFKGGDGREPLATSWGARFIDGGAFTSGTDLIVWRDSRVRTEPFPCGRGPSWYPIPGELPATVFFDEQENVEVPGAPSSVLPSRRPSRPRRTGSPSIRPPCRAPSPSAGSTST